MSEQLAVNPEGGASYKGRKARRHQPSFARVKMLAPKCDTCAEAAGGKASLQPGWWNDCEHDPYVSIRMRKETRPQYEDQEDGSKRLVGTEEFLVPEVVPNWVQVSHIPAPGNMGGRGVEKARRNGRIFPQQLRSPAYPEGIKRRCQFRDCFGEDLKKYQTGWFCNSTEAKLVKVANSGRTLEIGGFIPDSDAKRKRQLDEVEVGL